MKMPTTVKVHLTVNGKELSEVEARPTGLKLIMSNMTLNVVMVIWSAFWFGFGTGQGRWIVATVNVGLVFMFWILLIKNIGDYVFRKEYSLLVAQHDAMQEAVDRIFGESLSAVDSAIEEINKKITEKPAASPKKPKKVSG